MPSFLRDDGAPSAIISDGIVSVALHAVTTIGLTETYQFPPIGSSGSKALIGTHDDTISVSGALIGDGRYTDKLALEKLAEAGRRGTLLQAIPGGVASGLILITSMTIRTDMQIQSLTFTASAARRDVLDVAISLLHLPQPSSLGGLIDPIVLGVKALADWKGG